MFPGFDGLMTLSRREGVDIKPTLLRVLTDLYVQKSVHTAEEETQFVELASRLIGQVDDATLHAVRNRLSTYPAAPARLMQQINARSLSAAPATPPQRVDEPEGSYSIEPAWTPATAAASTAATPAVAQPAPYIRPLSMQADHAAEISALFFTATASERVRILSNLAETPLKPANALPQARADHAIEALQMAAFVQDVANFTREVSDALFIPLDTAEQIVSDLSGEPLVCVAKALDMPAPVFQRILIMLDPVLGASVTYVHRNARLQDSISARAALIMLAAWRGTRLATPQPAKPKHHAALYDDERQRARHVASQPSTTATPLQAPYQIWRSRNG